MKQNVSNKGIYSGRMRVLKGVLIMTEKPKEEVIAERLDETKKEREEITKDAIQKHEEDKPEHKESRKFTFTKKEDLL